MIRWPSALSRNERRLQDPAGALSPPGRIMELLHRKEHIMPIVRDTPATRWIVSTASWGEVKRRGFFGFDRARRIVHVYVGPVSIIRIDRGV